MICGLCHRQFDAKQARTSCSNCSLFRGCDAMRCPYCFYEMIAEPGWMKTLMALFRKQSKPKGQTVELERDAMPLTFLKPHVPARIDHLRMEERTKLKELIAMGILPGAKVMLLRKFPSYVFQIGQSQFSFDAELAATIYVKLLAG